MGEFSAANLRRSLTPYLFVKEDVMNFTMNRLRGAPMQLLLASVLLNATVQAQDEFSRQYKAVMPSVVTIYTSNGSGSGFGVAGTNPNGLGSETLIITNAHVVGDESSVQITTADKKTHTGEVVGRYAADDIALVRCQCVPALPLAAALPEIGSKAYVIGSPGLSAGWVATGSLTSGVVSNILIDDYLQLDASINHGNSGGPVFNGRGEVIGIATGLIEGKPGINFAISVTRIKRVLSDYQWTAMMRAAEEMERRRKLLNGGKYE